MAGTSESNVPSKAKADRIKALEKKTPAKRGTPNKVKPEVQAANKRASASMKKQTQGK